jgi:thiamine-monophosphate kinase
VPLSADLIAYAPDAVTACTAGDDYELLFALPPGEPSPVPATCIGGFTEGAGLILTQDNLMIALPPRLGFEHR